MFAFRRYACVVLLLLTAAACAQNPCAVGQPRALVLGGGGSKGAFEAGAAYHLIVHRGCDFAEISGTSVGALNGALLAQAARSDDGATSLANIQQRAEAMVAMWQSLHGSKDVVKGRPLASLRFGLFGLESMKNFAPLRKLLAANVDLERLDAGRELRVATVSFHDGRYHELVLNAGGRTDGRTLDFLLASAAIPMFATMPRLAPCVARAPENSCDNEEPVQFGDGGLRHNSLANSYFVECAYRDPAASPSRCRRNARHGFAPHQRVAQLFVVVTNPYERENEEAPVWDASAFRPGTHQITDGRKVMNRAVGVALDTVHHRDLDSLLLANDLLQWRSQMPAAVGAFPLESFNYDPENPDAVSQPYRIGIVAPAVGDGGLEDILSFSPPLIAKQLYCGCLAADEMMQAQFGLESRAPACQQRFRAAPDNGPAPDCRTRAIEPLWQVASEQHKGNSGAATIAHASSAQ